MAASTFVVPSRFAPSRELRRTDPEGFDWAGVDTLGKVAATFDAAMLPGVGHSGRPAYDYEALDSGEAASAATELARRGLMRPGSFVVPAVMPENPTRAQRRAHAYSRERAAYAAGRQVQALRVIDAVEAAKGGGRPAAGDEPLYERVEREGRAWLDKHPDEGPVPFYALLPFGGFLPGLGSGDPQLVGEVWDDEMLKKAATGKLGKPTRGRPLGAPAEIFGFLAGPAGMAYLMTGVYMAATALLGPIGVGLAAKGRRMALERNARQERIEPAQWAEWDRSAERDRARIWSILTKGTRPGSFAGTSSAVPRYQGAAGGS